MFRVGFAFAVGLAVTGSVAVGQEKVSIPECQAAGSSTRSSVTGTITDKSGAVIPSAEVQALCGARIFGGRTNENGHYSLDLRPGSYLLEVRAPGFAPTQQTIQLQDSSLSADVQLTLPQAANTVTVQGENGYVASDSTTAMKTDTPILETPQSISVLTRDQMDSQAPQDLSDALRYAPAVNSENEGTSANFWGGSSFFLRGFTPSIYQDGLTDDTYGNTLLDTYFYQRIEVLEGPSSTLFGQGSPAGLVNVVTKRPLATPFHEIVVGFGTYGRYEGNFDFSGPLGSPQVLYRLTGTGFREGTQTWFVDQKRLAIAPALTWLPDSRTSLTLLSNYTYNPAVGNYTALPALGTLFPYNGRKIAVSFFQGDPNYDTVKQSFLQLGDSFTRTFDHDWRIDQDFRFTGNRDHAEMMWPEGYESTGSYLLDRYSFARDVSFDSYLSDNRVSKSIQTGKLRQTLLAGLNYSRYSEQWAWGSAADNPINVFHPVYYQTVGIPVTSSGETVRDNQTGIYIQDQVAYGRFRLNFGGRQDWASDDTIFNGTATKQSDSKFTMRSGLTYLVGKGLAPYFSYATSFQQDLGLQESGANLPPTTGKQYELGVKYQPEHTNLQLTAAIYDLAEQNVGTSDPKNLSFTIPVGEIRSRGAEFSAHTSLRHGISVVGSYTYTASKYNRTDGNTGTGIDGTTESTQGKYQYAIPLNMASLWSDYTLPPQLVRGLGLSGGARFIGASWGDTVNSFQVPGATLFDGAIHYDFSHQSRILRGTRMQINASNLGNRTYVASCTDSDDCYYGLTRTVYGTMRYRW